MMITVASAVLGVLIVVVALLSVGIITVRAVRTVRTRRRSALAEGPRRALLAFVADNGEEGADDLVAVPDVAWEAAEPAAVALLGKVKGEAYQALVTVFERRGVIGRARRQLTARSPVHRARAAELLGDLGYRKAVADLGRLLEDPHADVRNVAVRALGRIAEPSAAWRLIASLDRPDPTSSLLVTDALYNLGPEATVTLSAALDHPQARARAVCLDALGLLGATATVDRVARVLRQDESLDVRIAAARTLGKLSARAALAPLVQALSPDNPAPLRAAAAAALGDLGGTAAVEPLTAALADLEYRVAHHAAHALRRIGGAGVAALRRVAGDPTPAGAHAREALALAAVGGPGAEPPAQTVAVAG